MFLFKRSSMVVKSYAKINLSLRVLSKKEDDYHNLEMVTLPIDLHDVIEIVIDRANSDTHITCDDIGLSNMHHNLCTKAVEAMRKEFGFKENFNISIHKEIPFAAGLGGGSSNAAAVIKALNSLLDLKADEETLNRVGLTVGADVPFFLKMKPALVTGIGEVVNPIVIKKPYFCLIVKPKEGLSTKAVFQASDGFTRSKIETAEVLRALCDGDDELLANSIGNDLYEPATSLLPVVKEIVEELHGGGLSIAAMTGSGSSCFALSEDPKKLRLAAEHMKRRGYFLALTKTLI